MLVNKGSTNDIVLCTGVDLAKILGGQTKIWGGKRW